MDLIQSILGPITGTTALLSVAAVFVAGFVRGFVGFGAAMIVIMALSIVLGPRSAVAVASLAGVVTTLQLLPVTVRMADRPFVVPFGIASFVAAPVGTLVLVTIDPALMKMAYRKRWAGHRDWDRSRGGIDSRIGWRRRTDGGRPGSSAAGQRAATAR